MFFDPHHGSNWVCSFEKFSCRKNHLPTKIQPIICFEDKLNIFKKSISLSEAVVTWLK